MFRKLSVTACVLTFGVVVPILEPTIRISSIHCGPRTRDCTKRGS